MLVTLNVRGYGRDGGPSADASDRPTVVQLYLCLKLLNRGVFVYLAIQGKKYDRKKLFTSFRLSWRDR